MREVAVAGVGMHPWGKFPDKPLIKMLTEVVDMALKEKILSNVYPLELETSAVLTLISYSKQQWDSPLYRAMPLHKNVDREGVLL